MYGIVEAMTDAGPNDESHTVRSEKGPDSESGDLACAISKTFINQELARKRVQRIDRLNECRV